MPWPLAWLRRKASKRQQPPQAAASNVEFEAIRAEQGSAKMPGVGVVDLESTRKTKQAPSVVVNEAGEHVMAATTNGLQRSTICPKAARVRPNNGLTVTELRLGPNKAPCCIVLTEDVAEYTPPKLCGTSR